MDDCSKRSLVQMRVSPEIKARVQAAALRENRTVSAWLRNVALRALTEKENAADVRAGRARRTRANESRES